LTEICLTVLAEIWVAMLLADGAAEIWVAQTEVLTAHMEATLAVILVATLVVTLVAEIVAGTAAEEMGEETAVAEVVMAAAKSVAVASFLISLTAVILLTL
jgi:hypothetical protein